MAFLNKILRLAIASCFFESRAAESTGTFFFDILLSFHSRKWFVLPVLNWFIIGDKLVLPFVELGSTAQMPRKKTSTKKDHGFRL